jgi:Xaa-Pro aminopeptidase
VYNYLINQVRDILREKGLDALLLTDPVSRRYLTLLASSAGSVLITPEDALLITDFRYIEVAKSTVSSYEIVMSDVKNKPNEIIRTRLGTRGKKVGFEAKRTTCDELAKYQKDSPHTFVPADEILEELRMIKTKVERDSIVSAQRIAEQALEDVVPLLKPGITERQVAAELIYQMLRGGADGISFEPIVVSGPNSSKPHGEPSDRKLAVGDALTLDFGALKNGYCSDMTRSFSIGTPSDELVKVYTTVAKAQQAGIDVTKAGVLGKTIHEAATKVIADAGYGEYFGHGFGHSVGLEIHENPNANAINDKPIPAGVVITAEPGIYIPGRFGIRIEDMLYITETGTENLTNAPRDRWILPL